MKFFTEPVIEVEKFELLDVIAVSNPEDWGGGIVGPDAVG